MNIEVMYNSLPALMQGFWITLELFAWITVLSAPLALIMGIVRANGPILVSAPIGIIIRIIRGTPTLVQLFIVYYGLAQIDWFRESWAWEFFRSPYWCAIFALTINAAAYNAHILRGAILAVPRGEVEAARAFGMKIWKVYSVIILPMALRIGLPAFGNELLKNMKRTAIASVITILELTGAANLLVARTLATFEIFIAAALLYLLLAFCITRIVLALEYWLHAHNRPAVSRKSMKNGGEV